MKLMTKEILNKIPNLYAQDGKGDEAVVYVKFFNPVGEATWYATEYDPETKTFFGWVELFQGEGELGYFTLDDLESVKLSFGMGIERDCYFGNPTLAEVKATRKGA